jgi:hypothetical protein
MGIYARRSPRKTPLVVHYYAFNLASITLRRSIVLQLVGAQYNSIWTIEASDECHPAWTPNWKPLESVA